MQLLCAHLPDVRKLSILHLCRRELSDKGMEILAEALSTNTSLKNVRLYSIGTSTRETCAKLMKSIRTSRLTSFGMMLHAEEDPTGELVSQFEQTTRCLRFEFPSMVALCCARMVPRLRKHSLVNVLPIDVYRRLAPVLYELKHP